jgi:hypothetical protein
MRPETILIDSVKGFLLALLYFELTKSNDTTPKNLFLFVVFYVVMINSASTVGIDPTVVTTAFITKTVFTLIDERIKRSEKQKNN